MEWASALVDLATVSIKAFDNHKQRQYKARIKSLRSKINRVEDSDFYSKDMEAKGKAERELHQELMTLKNDILKDAQ